MANEYMQEQIKAKHAEIEAMVELGFLPPIADCYRRFSVNGEAVFVIRGKRSKVVNRWRAEFINKHGTIKHRISWFDSPVEAANMAIEKWLK